MNHELNDRLQAALLARRSQFIADLRTILRMPSEKAPAAQGAPYGEDIRRALEGMRDICLREGLQAQCMQGHCTEAFWPGTADGSVAMLTHIDVVPPGEGWTRDPYGAQVEGSRIYARGASDNKGPGIATLYALLALRDCGFVPQKTVSLIYGGDEESGMTCMKYYLQHRPAPDMAFSPDAGFPVIHAEKTVINGTLRIALGNATRILDIQGGSRPNVVPGTAQALLRGHPSVSGLPADITAQQQGSDTLLIAHGRGAHGSTPHLGDNALFKLIGALQYLLDESDSAQEALRTLQLTCADTTGAGLCVDCADEATGALTMNVGIAATHADELELTWDIRHPVTLDEQQTMARMRECARSAGLGFEVTSVSPGVFVPKDHPLVRTLMGVYNAVTGRDDPPGSMGGGTYARTMPCAVAFGPGMQQEPETSGGVHASDEFADIDHLLLCARIFALCISELAG